MKAPNASQNKQMKDRPLALTKRGKLIAVFGGVLGGPIGMLLSPLVLMLVNLATRARGKSFNRFLVWGALGIIGIPVSLVATAAALLGVAVISDSSVLDGGIPAPSDPPMEGEIDAYEKAGAPKASMRHGIPGFDFVGAIG